MGNARSSAATAATEVLHQYAALCFRIDSGRPKVLLITSRGTQRWILPKGWAISGLSPAETAAREAWEEAGVQGRLIGGCLGEYSYDKLFDDGSVKPCVAQVFTLEVDQMAEVFPEQGQRRQKWLSPKKAALRVHEPELAEILRQFDGPGPS